MRYRTDSVSSLQSIDFGSDVDAMEDTKRQENDDERVILLQEEADEKARIALEIDEHLRSQATNTQYFNTNVRNSYS